MKKRYSMWYTTDYHATCENHKNDMPETAAEPVLRRSQRVKRAPDFYGVRVNVANSQLKEPTTLEKALMKKNGSLP